MGLQRARPQNAERHAEQGCCWHARGQDPPQKQFQIQALAGPITLTRRLSLRQQRWGTAPGSSVRFLSCPGQCRLLGSLCGCDPGKGEPGAPSPLPARRTGAGPLRHGGLHSHRAWSAVLPGRWGWGAGALRTPRNRSNPQVPLKWLILTPPQTHLPPPSRHPPVPPKRVPLLTAISLWTPHFRISSEHSSKTSKSSKFHKNPSFCHGDAGPQLHKGDQAGCSCRLPETASSHTQLNARRVRPDGVPGAGGGTRDGRAGLLSKEDRVPAPLILSCKSFQLVGGHFCSLSSPGRAMPSCCLS